MPKQIYSLNGRWKISGCEPGEGLTRKFHRSGMPTGEWMNGTVPGCVQLDVFGRGIQDLYFSMNVETIMWVERKEWWYRRSFRVPKNMRDGRLWLRFDGVDFESTVWLNDRKIAHHIGTFSPFEAEVTDIVRKNPENNELAVRINRAFHNVPMKSPLGNEYDWSLWLEQLGIWEGVSLIRTGDVRIVHAQVMPLVTAPFSEGRVGVVLEVDAAKAGHGAVNLVIKEDDSGRKVASFARTFKLKKGKNVLELSGVVPNVRLWWPNGYGEQALYQAEISIRKSGSKAASDQCTQQIGFREIVFENGPGMVPPTPEWIFRINGRRIYARGINWVPADQLPASMTRERYRHLLRRVKEGRHTIMRMWGGGGRQARDFYDFCDRYGIMLQQEFPLANQAIPQRSDIFDYALKEAEGIVRSIINHPSVVTWCGGNEFNFDPENPILLALGKLCNRLDPTRRFLNTSPIGQEMHSPWEYNFRTYYDIYNNHRQNMPMMSEFGCPGMLGMKSLRRCIPEAELEFPPERVPPYCEITLDEPVEARFVRMTITRVENACKAYNDIFNCFLPDGTDVTPYELRPLYNWKATSGSYPVIDAFDVIDEKGENLALKKKGAKVRASSERVVASEIKRRWPSVPDSLFGIAENIIDGQYGHHRCWASNIPHKGWFEIELPATARVRRFVWSRDRLGRFWNNLPIDYKIEVSLDGKKWNTVHKVETPGRSSYFNLYNNWAYHKGILGYDRYETWLYEDNLVDLFGVPREPEVYIAANQYIQCEGARYCIEHMRRQKYNPAGGSYFWQFNEPWPNISCDAVVDWYGEAKPAHYFVSKAYEDIHVSARYDSILWRPGRNTDWRQTPYPPFRASIWLHNDRLEEHPDCRLQMSVRTLDGKVLWSEAIRTQLLSDSARQVFDVEFLLPTILEDQVFALDLRLYNRAGQLLTSNVYFFGCSMPVYQPLLSAPATKLVAETKKLSIDVRTADEETAAIQFRNADAPYAVMVHAEIGGQAAEHFDAYHEDNEWILFSGQAVASRFAVFPKEATKPGKYRGTLALKGWNTNRIEIPVEIHYSL